MRENVRMELTSLFQNKGEKLESTVSPMGYRLNHKELLKYWFLYNRPDLHDCLDF